jgi:TonB family protein
LPPIRNNGLYSFPNERSKGIIGTLLFHVALFALLLLTGLQTPLPLPEEEGILVNFGDGDTGAGLFEPAASSSSSSSGDPDPGTPDNETAVSAAEEQPPVTAEEQILTQDFEEAPVVEKKAEVFDPDAELKKQQAIEEQKRIAEQLEAERIRRAAEEAERLKREAEAREAAELEARRQEIINRTRTSLENAAATGTATNANQGIAGGTGNQGRESGSVNSDLYGDGSGTGTRGVSFNLAGRTPSKLPPPTYNVQSEGIVVVEVSVDRNGNVTRAVPGVKGSTTLEEYFLRVAREAAMATKFDAKPDAPVTQIGTITYHFKLR